jgi:hypothetical protein
MNDLNSILIATTVLAIGGLGFYMYKSEQGGFNDENEFYAHDFDNLEEDMEDEDDFSSSSSSEDEDEDEEDDSKRKNKTRRNSNGNSKTKKKRN